MNTYHGYVYHKMTVAGVTLGEREISWEQYRLPSRIDGLTVLDIGAMEGGFSFEAERRGAKRVVASDCLHRPRFDLAKADYKSNVEWLTCSVYDLPEEQFDAVIFLAVLYHLRHPLLALEKVSTITRKWCILETILDATGINKPAMVYYPGAEYGGDSSNWWGPNSLLLECWFKEFGFQFEQVWSCPGRVAYMLKK